MVNDWVQAIKAGEFADNKSRMHQTKQVATSTSNLDPNLVDSTLTESLLFLHCSGRQSVPVKEYGANMEAIIAKLKAADIQDVIVISPVPAVEDRRAKYVSIQARGLHQ